MDKERDIFSEIIKGKLENYTSPVDDDSWGEIEKRLNTKVGKRVELRWIAAIAVAASIALLFILFQIDKKTSYQETANLSLDEEKEIIQNIPEEEPVETIIPQSAEYMPVVRKPLPRKILTANNLLTDVIPVKEVNEDVQNIPATKEEPVAVEKNPVSTSASVPLTFDYGNEIQIPVIKRKNRQSISFSFGSGNLLADNSRGMLQSPNLTQGELPTPDISHFRASTQEIAEFRAEEVLLYEDYTGVVNLLPLSFGISIKKELNRTFSLESGIVYSFVATKFNRDFPKSEAELQLHYIGIPLNAHTRISGDRYSRWEVYLSAGGMVEKGFLSRFTQKNYYGNDDVVKTTTTNEKIKGLQWSASVSPGVDYNIHKNYSVYLEPKLSYYFDNNQPVSARTKHPLVVGINAGIRYMW